MNTAHLLSGYCRAIVAVNATSHISRLISDLNHSPSANLLIVSLSSPFVLIIN